MANKIEHPLLSRPLYAFNLPEEIIQTLELRADLNATTIDEETDPRTSTPRSNSRINAEDGGPASATSCALCGLSFASLQEQRDHVRSDLHRYNLKQRVQGLQPVGEKDFDRLVEELDESISGSESSEDDSGDDSDDGAKERTDTTLTALLRKQANLSEDALEEMRPKKRKRGAGKPPLLWFTSSKLPANTSLGIYRTLFPDQELNNTSTLVKTLQMKQLTPQPLKGAQATQDPEDQGGVPLPNSMQHKPIQGPHYFLCMIGGGHFAAMIVALTPSVTKKGAVEDRSANVVAHKTFHRYTTRRKQGGSQSTNDNSKGNAHSAGSSLRRYNETALTNDVRALLADWKPWLATAELLFIRATGTTNRRTLFGPYDGQILTSKDPRIRGFPFATRRATQAELMRAFVELTRVKITTVDELEQARKAAEEAAKKHEDSLAVKPPSSPKPSKPKPSKEEEEALLHTSQLQSLIRRSKAPGLISYLSSNSLSPNFDFVPKDKPENYHAPNPLHLAASLNSPACVTALLLKARADPTVKNLEGKSAYDIAGDRATRDAFRLARSELGETSSDWDGAGVGPALTKAEAEARFKAEQAESEAEKAKEAERRKAELERLRREDKEKEEKDRERKFGKGRSVTNSAQPKTAEERREEEARGMTPEMRMRLERERRARAAEARLGRR